MVLLKIITFVVIISVVIVSGAKLKSTWGERDKNNCDSLICKKNTSWDVKFNGIENIYHMEKFECNLPEEFQNFTYAMVWAERKCLCTPDYITITQVHNVNNRYMYFEVGSNFSLNAYFEVYAKKEDLCKN